MAVFGGLARHNLFRFSFLKKNKLLLSFWPEEVWKKFIKDFLKGISEMLSDALVMITKNIRSNHWCMCYVYVTHRQGLGLVLGVCSLSPIQYSHKLVFHVYGSPLVWEDKRCVSVRAQAPKPRIIEGRKAETSSTAWRRGLHLKPSSCTIVSPQSRTLGCTERRTLKTC